MQNSEFEKTVQQKMEQLKITPADAVWEKVADALPEQKKPRRWIIFFLLFGLLAVSSLIWFNGVDTNNKKNIKQNNASKKDVLQNTIAENKEKNDKPIAADAEIKDNTYAININKTTAGLKLKTRHPNKVIFADHADVITAGNQFFETNAAAKIKVKASVPAFNDAETVTAREPAKEKIKISIPITDTDTANAHSDILIARVKENEIDSLIINKKDSLAVVSAVKSKKKTVTSKWTYGIVVASGIANVKNNLFGNTAVFARADNYSSSPPPVVQPVFAPKNPSTGLAINTGFYLQKNINKNWSFNTGLSYWYQYNTLRVGSKIDSAANFNFNNKSIPAKNFYKTGNAANYKNKFYLIEIPLLFQYQPTKKSPLFAEAGPSFAYLINSNALVYSGNTAVYFTNKDVFNKLIVSFNIGAGINLAAKTNFPFSIGYQFKYSAVSATQKYFGKQHFVNSMLYVKVPLKK